VNDNLKRLVHERLSADGMQDEEWTSLVLAACDGRETLEGLLQSTTIPDEAPQAATTTLQAGAFVTSLTVQGFRGIGPKQTLKFAPGPGLTIVIGRNGSGKSSFAEALEVLFTGDSKRWAKPRSSVWKDGWRNLHKAHPATIEADVILEDEGRVKLVCTWDDGAAFEAQRTYVQPRGKTKTSLEAFGPFLSYNELGSLLDEGPSKLYDALSLVLGLEDLVDAQSALSKSLQERKQMLKAADDARMQLVAQLQALLANEADERATKCLDALQLKWWRLDTVEEVLAADKVSPADQSAGILSRARSLESPDAASVVAAVAALRDADKNLRAVAGTDAEKSRELASLLAAALGFHAGHGDGDCPVCGKKAGLTQAWAQKSTKEVARLRSLGAESDAARKVAADALRKARSLITAPPALLNQLAAIGVEGAGVAREEWDAWHAGYTIEGLNDLGTHLESHHEALSLAIEIVRDSTAAELKRREDRWRPIAAALSAWIEVAHAARADAEHMPRIKAAETWLKNASADIRNERFAPIADKAAATWEHLRQQSNVTLGQIGLAGTGTKRKVTLDVTVDGIAGAALGVMSQGELHSLALSLFLPRATLADSPFRFVVIDDPVQSMDPARVDGLARALEDTAHTRQVIVFTHDERLPEAVRRLGIASTILSITRRPLSVVEVRTALDPVRAYIDDAFALVHTADLPQDVLRRLVPGFCRAALEAAFTSVIRRRHLSTGVPHAEVEGRLTAAGKLNTLAALALFDDKDKGGDVLNRLNQFGTWARDVFVQSKEGAHVEVTGDLQTMIRDTESLADKILAEVK
jgi:recombinational DNA repair ATPase RecF